MNKIEFKQHVLKLKERYEFLNKQLQGLQRVNTSNYAALKLACAKYLKNNYTDVWKEIATGDDHNYIQQLERLDMPEYLKASWEGCKSMFKTIFQIEQSVEESKKEYELWLNMYEKAKQESSPQTKHYIV